MLALRLLAGQGASFTPPGTPSLSPFLLNNAPDGALNPWCTPGAYSHGGYTYFPWVDTAGNVEVGVFNENSKTVTGRYTLHAAFEADAHTTPTLSRRASDGRIVAVYSLHNAATINVRVSTNPDDVSAWGVATDLDSQLGGSRYTDPQLYEVGGTLYLFYRDEPSAGTDSRWCISTTSAATPTSGWAAQTIVYRIASKRSYVISAIDQAAGLIHFMATNTSPPTALGHFYLDTGAGTYHKSDGTGVSLPLAYANTTAAYTGTTGVYASNIVIDDSGYPVVAAQDTIAAAFRYIYVWFNGTVWDSTDVAAAGTGYEYSGTGTGFGAWGSCIDDVNPLTMYTIEGTTQPEVYSHTTADDGATFDTVAITTGSTTPQHQLVCVRGASTALRAYWQFGTWTTYKNFNVGLRGLGY